MEQQVLRGRVIHVNEDGWVVINRGAQDGVSEGQRFAVLGERNPRSIRDLFVSAEAAEERVGQVVLRADTAYELLRVILVERQCCVAISDRVPPERTPQAFLGPQGELLVYTPPPADWRYDALDLDEADEDAPTAAQEQQPTPGSEAASDDTASEAAPEDEGDAANAADLAPRQQERLWDGALPLNALQVGDEVVMARPYHPGAWEASAAVETTAPAAGDDPPTPATSDSAAPDGSYDWLKL